MSAGRFSISVKDINGRSYLIELETSWSVEQLKREVSRQTLLPINHFELVFAGSVLKESQTLSVSSYMYVDDVLSCMLLHFGRSRQSFGLQSYSTLHCIQNRGRNSSTGSHASLCDVDLVSIPVKNDTAMKGICVIYDLTSSRYRTHAGGGGGGLLSHY